MRNWQKGRALRTSLNACIAEAGAQDLVELIGEDCLIAMLVKSGGIHKLNVARTFFLQELVRRGQLFQGLFYPTPAHDEAALQETIQAWREALPLFKRFTESGHREELLGDPTKPVFRAFNSCECLSSSDCLRCHDKLKGN